MKMLTLLLLLTAPGIAAAADPAHARMARELSMVMMPEETWNKLLDNMAEDISRGFAHQPNPPSKEQFAEGMREFIKYKEMIDLQTAMLVKHYTADEVRELSAFYKTPLGQKVLKVTPEVTRDVNAELQAKLQTGMPKLMAKFRAKRGSPDAAPPPVKKR